MMRRYPRIGGPAVLPLFCLAPHGVFPASRIAPRAVSSYLAFSPLPALCCQRTGGVFSVTLSVTALLQTQCPRLLRGMLPYGVRTFLWRTLRCTSDHLPSPELITKSEIWKPQRKIRHPKFESRISRLHLFPFLLPAKCCALLRWANASSWTVTVFDFPAPGRGI